MAGLSNFWKYLGESPKSWRRRKAFYRYLFLIGRPMRNWQHKVKALKLFAVARCLFYWIHHWSMKYSKSKWSIFVEHPNYKIQRRQLHAKSEKSCFTHHWNDYSKHEVGFEFFSFVDGAKSIKPIFHAQNVIENSKP